MTTILVAFDVETDDRVRAYLAVTDVLSGVADRLEHQAEANREAELPLPDVSWHIAEDDRWRGADAVVDGYAAAGVDARDRDSAVFCTPGRQHAASWALHVLGLTGACNVVTPETMFSGEPIGGSEKSATHGLVPIDTWQQLRSALGTLRTFP